MRNRLLKLLTCILYSTCPITNAESTDINKSQCTVSISDGSYIINNQKDRTSWSIKPESISPYLKLNNNLDSINVTADCSWAAIKGDTDYRYVWLISQSGNKTAFKTIGTPRALTFNSRGDRLAFGTSAGHFYIADLSGNLIRHEGSFGIFMQIEYIDQDRLILAAVNGGGILFDDNAKIIWRTGNMDVNYMGVESKLQANSDYQWFRLQNYFYHEGGYEWILLSKTGQEHWRETYRVVNSDNITNDIPLKDEEKSADVYIEHLVNSKLNERIAIQACTEHEKGDAVIQQVNDAIYKISSERLQIDLQGCGHVLYRSEEQKAPKEFFEF